MTTKPLIPTLALAISLYASQALARPDLTPEQLAKAKETALNMNPPIDVAEMLKEADRLGVECEGDLTLRYKIKMCYLRVDTAQSKERQVKLDKENAKLDEINAKLDEENKALRKEIKRTLEETKQIAKGKQK
jgi:type I restriction-modification system DNA methylase subunit